MSDEDYVSVLERGDMASPRYRKKLEKRQALEGSYPEQLLLGIGSLLRPAAGTARSVAPSRMISKEEYEDYMKYGLFPPSMAQELEAARAAQAQGMIGRYVPREQGGQGMPRPMSQKGMPTREEYEAAQTGAWRPWLEKAQEDTAARSLLTMQQMYNARDNQDPQTDLKRLMEMLLRKPTGDK